MKALIRALLYRRLSPGELVDIGDIAKDGLGWFQIRTGPYRTAFTKPYPQTERTHYRRLRSWALPINPETQPAK